MALHNPHDDATLAAARAEQADPLVMYLVVRREAVVSLDALLAAVAEATVHAAHTYAKDPRWAADMAAWQAGSFRKVCLRANERDWARLLARLECTLAPGQGEPLVAALPVRLRSASDSFLRSLQAYTLALDELPAQLQQAAAEPALLFAFNPQLAMSAGKLAAQVGHAALMVADAAATLQAGQAWAQAAQAWEEAGLPAELVRATQAGWAAALAQDDWVAVVDAGLTAINAGSVTVIACRPRSGDALAEARELLTSS